MCNLVLGYNTEARQLGVKSELVWDSKKFPHLLVFGSTGSGKTYFCKLLLARIGLHISDANVVVCDFKADDFKFLNGTNNYYSFLECKDGFQSFYNAFISRQSGVDESKSFKLLFFDEWASYLNMLDKKEAENAKNQLATLLMLGRSFNIHVIISQQRADAAYFATARDNFSIVVALGSISKESKAMFFNDFKDNIKPCNTGEGYVLYGGSVLKSITVPTAQNTDKLIYYIRKALNDN